MLPSKPRGHAPFADETRRTSANAKADTIVRRHSRVHIVHAKLLPRGDLPLNVRDAVSAELLALEHAVLRLLHAVRAELLTFEALILGLALHAHLPAFKATVLRLALDPHLLTLEATILSLALHAELLAFRPLESEATTAAVLTRHREALHLRRRETTAAVTMATATAALECLELRSSEASATVAATTAAGGSLEVRIAATTTTAVPAAIAFALPLFSLLTATTLAVTRLCSSRARDRQGGDAGGEEQPGHGISPSERKKRLASRTVPTSKRVEPAV
ncbi:MAG TPA: hypothetical protein VNS11_06480 [Sphingomicrobium sp.]|nr:hypothetical protein [Sphingomicrobium sp.]